MKSEIPKVCKMNNISYFIRLAKNVRVRISNIISLILLFLLAVFSLINQHSLNAANENPYWEIQSVDTVKLSRDLAREKMFDESFINSINDWVGRIADAGATHIAIGTPYDPEFLPYMKLWVAEARKRGLNVWFRGNFSGWEGWFGYAKIAPGEHILLTKVFIRSNPNLFEDGDIFTPCTECENGVIGDPRSTGNVDGFRNFLMESYIASSDSFKSISRNVKSGYFSMNGDVAKLVMDKKTTENLGGIVIIDHYVNSPIQLATDITDIATSSGGKVVLGEIGAPIPDIHGNFDVYKQEDWLKDVLALVAKNPDLIGINYWTASGSSTSLWYENGEAKPALGVLSSYYKPEVLSGKVEDSKGRPMSKAKVMVDAKYSISDNAGNFSVVKNPSSSKLIVSAKGYKEVSIEVENSSKEGIFIVLQKKNENFIYKLKSWVTDIFGKIKIRF